MLMLMKAFAASNRAVDAGEKSRRGRISPTAALSEAKVVYLTQPRYGIDVILPSAEEH